MTFKIDIKKLGINRKYIPSVICGTNLLPMGIRTPVIRNEVQEGRASYKKKTRMIISGFHDCVPMGALRLSL
jgi:hypothetical protein